MTDLTDKVAIISGGATMIGEYIAIGFLRAGANVVLCDIDNSSGRELAKAHGDRVIFVHSDITKDNDIDNVIQTAQDKWKRIDFLVNVACTYLDKGLESSREDWLRSLNVNLVSAALFIQKAAGIIGKSGGGSIVNLGSIGGKVAQPDRLLYSCGKAAILGMTRNMALLLRDSNIRVNSVSPGWTWSNVIKHFSGNNRDKADEVAEPLHLVGRCIEPEEVANATLFLCSDEASGITGTDLAVDGGYMAIGPEQKLDKTNSLAN